MVKISPRINSRHILLHLSYSRFHVLSSFCAISLAEALAHSTMVGSNSLRIPSIDHVRQSDIIKVSTADARRHGSSRHMRGQHHPRDARSLGKLWSRARL